MKKIWYDQRCVHCHECVHFRPAGKRPDSIVPDEFWPDACSLYGYSLSDRFPVSEDCDGLMTEKQQRKLEFSRNFSSRNKK